MCALIVCYFGVFMCVCTCIQAIQNCVSILPILRGLVDVRQHEVQTFRVIYVQRQEPDEAEVVDERAHGFVEPGYLRTTLVMDAVHMHGHTCKGNASRKAPQTSTRVCGNC
jgi:hypothetical protein